MANSQEINLENPKVRQILEGARTVFLECGYEGASTDKIARQAGVSKGTLYNYFPDKQVLFKTFIQGECNNQTKLVFKIDTNSGNIETMLREIALNYVKFFLSPFLQGIFRLVVAEAVRFPNLARIFYDSGPDLGVHRIKQLLAGAVARGELAIDDENLELAAHQFFQLCRANLFDKYVLQIKSAFTQEEINLVAEGAVTLFLRAYRP